MKKGRRNLVLCVIISLVFFGVGKTLTAQIKEPVTGLTYLDNGQTDSLIRKYVKIPLTENYYIFTYPTAMAATAAAGYIKAGFNSITKDSIRQCNEDILVVFNNAGGYKKSYFPKFFSDVFHLPAKIIPQIKYTVNDTLYYYLENSYLSKLPKLLYVHQGRLLYKENTKWHKIKPAEIHHDKFEIQSLLPIIIKENTFRLRAYDELYAYKKGKLLISTDLQDCLLELDASTGNITNNFCTTTLDPTEFFCQYIANYDSAKCGWARKHNIESINLNRQMIDISLPQPDEKGNIYAYASVEAEQELTEDYSGYDDEDNYKVFPKGHSFLHAYWVMFKISPNFKITEVHKNVETYGDEQADEEKYSYYDNGFFIKNDSTFITYNDKYDWDSLSSPFNLFSDFVARDKKLIFKENYPHEITKQLAHYLQNAWGGFYFFRFQDKIYALFGSHKYIFSLEHNKPIDSLAGDGTQQWIETFPEFIEDTTEYRVNYTIHSVSPIFSGSHLAIIYSYKEKLMLEIKNQQLKTVYTSDFIRIPGFEKFYEMKYARTSGYYFPIQDDTIYFMALENEEYKLFRYLIQPICAE